MKSQRNIIELKYNADHEDSFEIIKHTLGFKKL